MKPVTIYTTAFCPYCTRALALLNKKKVVFKEIAAGFNKLKKQEMIQRSNGARTFPQIFIGNDHIGGCDELYALNAANKLDGFLQN